MSLPNIDKMSRQEIHNLLIKTGESQGIEALMKLGNDIQRWFSLKPHSLDIINDSNQAAWPEKVGQIVIQEMVHLPSAKYRFIEIIGKMASNHGWYGFSSVHAPKYHNWDGQQTLWKQLDSEFIRKNLELFDSYTISI